MNKDRENKIDNISTQKTEIDLVQIIMDLWKRRKLIFWFIAVITGVGILIAFTTPKEFNSEVRLLPEITDQKGGSSLLRQFSGLGNLAGINLGALGSQDAISPNLYPDIVKSTPFLLRLMDEELILPHSNIKVTLYQYLVEHKPFSLTGVIKRYTIGLPGEIIGLFTKKSTSTTIEGGSSDFISLTADQYAILLELKDRIRSSVDKRNGIVILSMQMPEPLHAAILTDKIATYLTEYITTYRTEKAVLDYNFIKDRHKEAESDFLQAQKKLSAFRDENKNIISARILSEEERLQSEYNLAFNLYNSLSLEMEQARINVQKETPVFKVLNPAEIAVLKIKPKKATILVLSVIFGVLLAFSYLILESIYYNIKSRYL